MSNAGLRNVMWTKQPASRNNIERADCIVKEGPDLQLCDR